MLAEKPGLEGWRRSTQATSFEPVSESDLREGDSVANAITRLTDSVEAALDMPLLRRLYGKTDFRSGRSAQRNLLRRKTGIEE